MSIRIFFIILAVIWGECLPAQTSFTRRDSLKGSLRPERAYNVMHYTINLKVDPSSKSLEGSVEMEFIPLQAMQRLQIDLASNMELSAVRDGRKLLKFTREFGAVFIDVDYKEGSREKLVISYRGKPAQAKTPPWDGGFIWKTDEQGNAWVGVSCQGPGASIWWPCKDHLSDEPDEGIALNLTLPENMMGISNGQLVGVDQPEQAGWKTWHWKVSYPINTYNVSIYAGDYVHFQDSYTAGDSSKLALNYYVLRGNEEKAKSHFRQVGPMLACYEKYFGKYPFWNDGYALVEAPYLGMEHQSAVAYGNGYQRGYLGGRIPEEFNFDYIIIHESGHEYFGNALSVGDNADLWLHEGLTTYLEAIYVECMYGKKASLRYLESQRSSIRNAHPLVGPRGVHFTAYPDSDIYYKGSWVLQTLRFALKNDASWFKLLRAFYEANRYRIVDTDQWKRFVDEFTGKDFGPFFEQYLHRTEIPAVELKTDTSGHRTRIYYRLVNAVEGLELPVEISLDGRTIQLDATTREKNIEFSRAFKSVKAVNAQALVRCEP
ncbi:MAG: M1 family metallopeptidase [Saprospiraceae bacterium]|jgi:aminopeptidase N|nr:M1 family metallopeptidase [Saprospiraceae bacterium]MBP9210032.1 M1 family metallopeptidase [Saprospiraceae bacterium]